MRYKLIVLILLLPSILYSQVLWIKGSSINITQRLSVLEDTSGRWTIDDVAASPVAAQFRSSDQPVLNFGFTQSVYWLRFTIEVPESEKLLLELEHAFIPNANLFYKNSDSTWTSLSSGYEVSLKKKIINHHNQIFPLPTGRQIIYVRLIPYLHPVEVNVWEQNSFSTHVNNQWLIYGIYVGILFFAIAINLFLFFSLRKSFYLLYAILVFLYLSASAGVMEGYLIYILPEADMMFWYKLIPVLNMPALLFYCLSFLEIRTAARTAHKITVVLAVAIIVYICILFVTPLMPYLVINQVLAFIVFLHTIALGIYMGRRGNMLGYYFSITYVIWFILLCFEYVYIHFGVPPHIFDLSYVSVAMFVETFMLAFLQARRFRWERMADEKARLDMQRNIIEIEGRLQNEIMQAQLEMQEQTLRSISQEIHDNIGQTLSFVKINLNLANGNSAQPEKERLVDSIDLLSKAIQDLRDLTRTLSVDYISEVGLTTAIEEQVSLLRKTGAFYIELLVIGRIESFTPKRELLVFRIVQEMLNNAMKHANATQIMIKAKYTDENLMIEFEDNGRGFDVGKAARLSKGFGLKNITHRAELLGGSITLDTQINLGTRLKLVIPKVHSSPGTAALVS